MKIIISGANGFLGTALLKYFAQGDCQIVPVTRQNFSYTADNISTLLLKQKPDIFIHAAGSSSVLNSYATPAESRQGSVELTRVILDGLQRAQTLTRLIHFSSAAVYGNPHKLPIAEDAPLQPISPYGEHKLESERLVEKYSAGLELQPLTVRIFSLFGEQQRRLVLYELFQKFMDRDRQIVNIRGTGEETRDFLSIEIFCRKLAALIAKNPNIPVVNIASGEARSILEAAQIMGSLLGVPDKPIVCSGEEMMGNPPHWQADTTLYDQIVSKGILFDFAGELSKTLAQWKTLQKT